MRIDLVGELGVENSVDEQGEGCALGSNQADSAREPLGCGVDEKNLCGVTATGSDVREHERFVAGRDGEVDDGEGCIERFARALELWRRAIAASFWLLSKVRLPVNEAGKFLKS